MWPANVRRWLASFLSEFQHTLDRFKPHPFIAAITAATADASFARRV